MTRIILDATLRSKLPDLSQPLELCDESGKVVARVTPVFDPSEYEPQEPPPLSEEELRRREKSDRWYTTEQVLAHLKSLPLGTKLL
jgi:hypothetical protein